MKKMIFCLSVFLITLPSFAYSPYWIGLGSTTRNFSTAQSDPDGKTVKFKLNPTILVGASLPFLYSGFFLSPAIGYGIHSTEDDSKRSEIILQYHLTQQLSSLFYLHYGLSNTITKISGKGGSVSLNNGNSTSQFYTPKESKTSYLASLDLAGEFLVSHNAGTRIQFSIDRFLSGQNQSHRHS